MNTAKKLNTEFFPFPILSTERLILRKIEMDDQIEIFALRSDPEVMKYIGKQVAKEMEDAIKLISAIQLSLENKDGITWGITLKGENKVIGTIGFWKIAAEHFRGEIGYALGPTFHRKGIMHEAVSAALEYGFNQMNLHSVEAILDPQNAASVSLLEKNNFIREGFFKENYFFQGKFLDSGVYSLLRSNYTVI